MTDGIEPLLARLAEPAPPPTLAAAVMARIAREPEPARVVGPARSPVTIRSARPAWLWAVAGLAIVLALTLHGWVSAESPPDVTSSRVGMGRLVLMPVAGREVLLLGLGLWLFLRGLFAPLRGDRKF